MRLADLVTASFLALLGGLVVFDAVRLGTGWGTDGPQSGFLPFWLGALLIAACVTIFLQAARRADGSPFVTRQQLGPVLKVLAPAVAFVALLGGALRRRYHVGALQHPGRAVVGRDDLRRVPAGPTGTGRPGAHGRLHLVVRRRAVLDRPHHVLRAPAGGGRAEVRAARVLRDPAPDVLELRGARGRQPGQVAGRDPARLHPGRRGARRRDRSAPDDVRLPGPHEGLRLHRRGDRSLRNRRDPPVGG